MLLQDGHSEKALCDSCFFRDEKSDSPGAARRSQWCSNCSMAGHSAWACRRKKSIDPPPPPKPKASWWTQLQLQVNEQTYQNRMAGRYGAI